MIYSKLISLFSLVTVVNFLCFNPPKAVALPPKFCKENGDIHYELGKIKYQKNEIKSAIFSWKMALQCYQEMKNHRREGDVLLLLGYAYITKLQYQQAIQVFESFLSKVQKNRNIIDTANALANLGLAYEATGQYRLSIDTNQKALALMKRLSNRTGESHINLNLGSIFERLGDYDNAKTKFQDSLKISRSINDHLGMQIALGNLGVVQSNLGEYKEAIKYHRQGLAIAQKRNDISYQATAYLNLGIAFHAQSEDVQAKQAYEKSLAISQTHELRKNESLALASLGLFSEAQKDYEKAVQYYQSALLIATKLQAPHLQAKFLNNLGHVYLVSGQLLLAEMKLLEAIQLLDTSRAGLPDLQNVNIFDTQVFSYNLIQQVLISQNRPESALEFSEHGRARAFVNLLSQRRKIHETDVTSAQPPSIKDIRQIAQNQNATLVEYTIIPDDNFIHQGKQRGVSSKLYIWVVKPTGEVIFRQRELKSLQLPLSTLVTTSREAMGVGGRGLTVKFLGNTNQDQHLQQLHEILIAPIADLLPSTPQERVVFIAQDSLFMVPFAALKDQKGTYLIEKHTILTAPAMQVLPLTRQQQRNIEKTKGQPLVVGNPTMPTISSKLGEPPRQLQPLPGAEQEAKSISQFLSTSPLIGADATKVEVIRRLPAAKLIHLATHGLLDDFRDSGIPGAIALAPSKEDDGLLTASELLDLNLNADLVVLSACDTGRGEITGDGVVGLSRSFIAAGTPSVVVSLWSVPDAPTATLMEAFYRFYQQRNYDKAQALRMAMLTTLKDHPNPRDWAAFTLIGEAQ